MPHRETSRPELGGVQMRRPMTARAAVTALLALLLVLPGTAAAAAWLSPVHFGGTTGAAPSPAVDASGNAIVGWQAGTPSVIQAARHAVRSAPGFAALPNLSPTAAFEAMTPVRGRQPFGQRPRRVGANDGPDAQRQGDRHRRPAAEWHDRRSDEGRLGGDESRATSPRRSTPTAMPWWRGSRARDRGRDAPGVERHVHAHDDAGHA